MLETHLKISDDSLSSCFLNSHNILTLHWTLPTSASNLLIHTGLIVSSEAGGSKYLVDGVIDGLLGPETNVVVTVVILWLVVTTTDVKPIATFTVSLGLRLDDGFKEPAIVLFALPPFASRSTPEAVSVVVLKTIIVDRGSESGAILVFAAA